MSKLTWALVVACAISSVLAIANFLNDRSSTVSAAYAKTPCPVATAATKTEVPEVKSPNNIRKDKIVDSILQFMNSKTEIEVTSKMAIPLDIDEYAQMIRGSYQISGRLDDVIRDIEVNQIRENEIGFNTGDVRKVQKAAIKQTLQMIRQLRKKGTTNVCIYEGACFSTKAEIDEIIKDLQ